MRINATTNIGYRVVPMFVVKKKTARRMAKPSSDH
jgi:hypothetical protein